MDLEDARRRIEAANEGWEKRWTDSMPLVMSQPQSRLAGSAYTTTHQTSTSLIEADRFAIFDIFARNMRSDYKITWGWDPIEKKKEMFSDNSHYIVVSAADSGIVAFTHFQFCFDDDDEPEYAVLYCFEVQVEAECRRQGLGEYLMNCLKRLSYYWHMDKLALTVLKKSHRVMQFYKRLGFEIDPSSPSQFREKAFYEIMSIATVIREECNNFPQSSSNHLEKKRKVDDTA